MPKTKQKLVLTRDNLIDISAILIMFTLGIVLTNYMTLQEMAACPETAPVIIETQNKYWNETEENRIDRECVLLCTGFETYIPIIHRNSCVCCDTDDNLDPYVKCVY